MDDSEGEDEKQTRSHEEREAREEISSQRREEIEAIQRAMDEENERVGSAQPRLSTEEDDRPKRSRGMVNAQHYSVVVKSAYHSKTFSNGKPKKYCFLLDHSGRSLPVSARLVDTTLV